MNNSISIGIHVRDETQGLNATLASLREHSPAAELLLLSDGSQDPMSAVRNRTGLTQLWTHGRRGSAAAFNRLSVATRSDVIVFLQSGCIVSPGWLQALLAALDADPSNGLAGPSTSRSWNEQCVFPNASGFPHAITRTARLAQQQFSSAFRTLDPLYSLADFCYAVKREVVDAIGTADEDYGLGPCWEMDYNIRAHRAGFHGVWACASYVYRPPLSDRRAKEEMEHIESSKRRYQDKFCGLRLRGVKQDFRTHCRGDACPNFAPQQLIEIRRSQIPEPGIQIGSMNAPLVTCIMPTWNRRAFIPGALACFLAQDYPNLELLVIDDGSDPIRDLLPADPRIRYFRLDEKLNIGSKRNFACARAQGEFIAHCDDDDWYPSSRISRQVHALQSSGAGVTGTSTNYFYDPRLRQGYRYTYAGSAGDWLAAPVYRRSVWERKPFDAIQVGEDVRFVAGIPKSERLDLRDPGLVIAMIHAANTSPKVTRAPFWRSEKWENIVAVMSGSAGLFTAPSQAAPLVTCIMPTFNRRRFIPLAIECFRSQTYPNKQLVVVDDGDSGVGDLLEGQPNIRYVGVRHRMTVGGKRNLACEQAAGTLIAHWDDDDWYAPNRLAEQINPLIEGTCDMTALANNPLLEMKTGKFWTVSAQLQDQMCFEGVYAGTLVYPRSFWQDGTRYPDQNLAEDAGFLRQLINARKRILRIDAGNLFVYIRHGTNTWKFGSGTFLDPAGWRHCLPPRGFSSEIFDAYRSASMASEGRTLSHCN
ncbi:MAG TPA: glycosyltransferase [Terracidiphilus sp.]|jgi:glycosyltransferase involved in cell wall biosynthesis